MKRLFLQPDANAVLAQISGGQVGFKNAKAQSLASWLEKDMGMTARR